jgi:aryl sulfotransferase
MPGSEWQHASVEEAYVTLCDVRDAIARSRNARLSAAGFDDIPEDSLLILCAMKAIEALALRGYLEFRNSPNGPRGSTMVFTERGLSAVREASTGVHGDPWAEFPFRSGDIVISSVPKSGTTWVQMICALLIFQTPRLPASIPELSLWLESQWRKERTRMWREFAAQQHRRFMKTHMPLNEIPADPRVTYIVVARHPFDVAISHHHQDSVLMTQINPGQPSGSERLDESARQYVLHWIDQMGTILDGDDSYFDGMLKGLSCAWERRAEPNVVLVHYEDLSADLPGEMRRLAKRLDITVPEDKWPSLVQAATFEQMRAAADQLQPLQQADRRDVSKGHAAFFRRGSSGDGRALLTEAEAARYYTRAAQVAPQELLAWLHRDS